jgi:hypothetical protein
MFIGLMGVGSDGSLYKPNGEKLFKVPMWLASKIQRIQHYIAGLTWK